MSTELCIASICSSPEAWSVWAAWAQAILTVATFIYAMWYQQKFNKLQTERERQNQLRADFDRTREEQILFTAGLLHLRRARLDSLRKIRSSIENEFPSPMKQWEAVKSAMSDSTHYDNVENLIRFRPLSWALIKSANFTETLKHIPLDKRLPVSDEEAANIINEIKPSIQELLKSIEKRCQDDEEMVEKYTEELFEREKNTLSR